MTVRISTDIALSAARIAQNSANEYASCGSTEAALREYATARALYAACETSGSIVAAQGKRQCDAGIARVRDALAGAV